MSSGTLPIQDSDSIGQSHLVLEFFSKCKCMMSASAVGRGSSKRYCFHPHSLANTQQTLVTAGVVSLTDTYTHTQSQSNSRHSRQTHTEASSRICSPYRTITQTLFTIFPHTTELWRTLAPEKPGSGFFGGPIYYVY